jgi:hypothetical protein
MLFLDLETLLTTDQRAPPEAAGIPLPPGRLPGHDRPDRSLLTGDTCVANYRSCSLSSRALRRSGAVNATLFLYDNNVLTYDGRASKLGLEVAS